MDTTTIGGHLCPPGEGCGGTGVILVEGSSDNTPLEAPCPCLGAAGELAPPAAPVK